MTTIHPHWQATEDDAAVPVSVVDSLSAQPTAKAEVKVRTVSRRPAAVIGVLAVLGFAYATLGNPFSLPAQVGGRTVTVVLSADGASPKRLETEPGVTVEWKNEDTIPHVLSFEKLKVGGKALETAPIFPGSSLTMLIPDTTKKGTYAYASKTSSLAGSIVIADATSVSSATPVATETESSSVTSETADMGTVSESMANPLTEVLMPDGTVQTLPPSGSVRTPPNPSATTATAVLPVNIHTVGNPNQGPVEPLHGGAPLAQITRHKPVTTTQSGPALRVLLAATAVSLFLATRRAFR